MLRYPRVAERDAYLVLFRDLAAEGSYSSHNAQVVECGGVQLMRQRLNISSNFRAVFLDIFQILFCRAKGPIRRAIFLSNFH